MGLAIYVENIGYIMEDSQFFSFVIPRHPTYSCNGLSSEGVAYIFHLLFTSELPVFGADTNVSCNPCLCNTDLSNSTATHPFPNKQSHPQYRLMIPFGKHIFRKSFIPMSRAWYSVHKIPSMAGRFIALSCCSTCTLITCLLCPILEPQGCRSKSSEMLVRHFPYCRVVLLVLGKFKSAYTACTPPDREQGTRLGFVLVIVHPDVLQAFFSPQLSIADATFWLTEPLEQPLLTAPETSWASDIRDA